MTDFTKLFDENLRQIDELKKKNIELLKKRKEALPAFLTRIIEELEMLALPDALLAGALFEVQKAVEENSPKLQEWEKNGARFLKPARKKSATSETA